MGWSFGAIVAVLLITFVASKIACKHSVIDTAWGLLFCAVAVTTFVASHGHGDDLRRWLLLLLPMVWGLRLATHIARRSRGKPEDPRYEQFLTKSRVSAPQRNPDLYALRSIYLLQ